MVTARQFEIVQFIKKYTESKGYGPTLQEIATAMGIQSRGAIHRHVQALQDADLLSDTQAYQHRGIMLKPSSPDNLKKVTLPLVGTIAAGHPIEAIEQPDLIDLYGMFGGDDHFALRVRGDSMIEEGILDGDIVVCKRSITADDGSIVVALIDGQEATLKRLKRERGGFILLIPANSQLAGMRYHGDRVRIQGIFMGLLRLPI